ncbi:DNA polymerase III subunit delta' [Desulfotalea psychrophila]|uniref:Related to DNA polymerase III, delta subunit n=1 Tax=Desulfotalea psychrophila (strain LSv54 / DSM 12343) TaxID=177439 RepID=Q6AQ60_DESPS|nr:DNA polymerase III subunit delta' [Desulfotalea psychrophila]CAG35513.1 related to DNA polymerase III, delta subunit [Desulfotalea psychrophila LSv54]
MYGQATRFLCYSQVLGQQRAKQIVARAIEADRVPHAYLFKGPDGVGKKLFARGVAAALNCRERQGAFACGHCVSCRKLLSGNHPDYTVVQPDKGAIKIDQVRSLCRDLSFPPYESPVRVVVLEDVHTMRREAANSLLKTLEEPPQNNVLILTAESSCEILTTISSRCQVVSFYPLTENEVSTALQGKELPPLAENEQGLLARLAEGSPGKMLLLSTTAVLPVWKKAQKLFIDPALQGDAEIGAWLQCAEEIALLKEDMTYFFAILRLMIRDHLLNLSGVQESLCSLTDWGFSENKLRWSRPALLQALHYIDTAEKKMVYNCNNTLVCEVLLFALQRLK